jgi:hypothetical protein
MKLQELGFAPGVILCALGLCGMAVACNDDEPCDPGQVVRNTQCYPAPASGGETGSGGAQSGGEAGVASGAPSSAAETPFGTTCHDTADSADCAGVAPICADLTKLGQTVMCTQINCAAGEANAGVCPAGFTCFAFPGYPSVCTKE